MVGDSVGAMVGDSVGAMVGPIVVGGAVPVGAMVGAAVGAAPTGEVCAWAGNMTLSIAGRAHLPGTWLPAEMTPPPTSKRRTVFLRPPSCAFWPGFLFSVSSLDILADLLSRNGKFRVPHP